MLVSIAGIIGSCCRVSCLLWFYLLVMFLLILLLFCFTIFAFVVTNKGAGRVVSGRGYKEYRVGDYSNWLQKRVGNEGNWRKIKSCLQDSKICQKLTDNNETIYEDVYTAKLSAVQVCMWNFSDLGLGFLFRGIIAKAIIYVALAMYNFKSI